MFNQLKPLAALIATALISTSALAATQTLDAGNYTISFDDSALGLFGTPLLTASGLTFAPGGNPGFTAASSSAISTATSTVALTITADAGYALTGFSLTERGSYYKFEDSSKVFVGGTLGVQDLVNTSASVTKQVALGAPLNATTSFEHFATTDWSATAGAQLNSAKAVVSIYSILGAFAVPGAGGYASIGKNNVVLDVNVTAVPEPQSFAMLLAGLGIVGAVARRRRIGA